MIKDSQKVIVLYAIFFLLLPISLLASVEDDKKYFSDFSNFLKKSHMKIKTEFEEKEYLEETTIIERLPDNKARIKTTPNTVISNPKTGEQRQPSSEKIVPIDIDSGLPYDTVNVICDIEIKPNYYKMKVTNKDRDFEDEVVYDGSKTHIKKTVLKKDKRYTFPSTLEGKELDYLIPISYFTDLDTFILKKANNDLKVIEENADTKKFTCTESITKCEILLDNKSKAIKEFTKYDTQTGNLFSSTKLSRFVLINGYHMPTQIEKLNNSQGKPKTLKIFRNIQYELVKD